MTEASPISRLVAPWLRGHHDEPGLSVGAVAQHEEGWAQGRAHSTRLYGRQYVDAALLAVWRNPV